MQAKLPPHGQACAWLASLPPARLAPASNHVDALFGPDDAGAREATKAASLPQLDVAILNGRRKASRP